MEELSDTRSLVELQNDEGDGLSLAMDALGKQVGILIKNRIFHVDLHPGNVLVSNDGRAFIVDFDKARIFTGGEAALRELYLRRWRRAVIKHKLSPVLAEMMSLTLRSYSE
jgi:3-deoxy-D-manno-octulosonic acid kinase